MMSTLSGVVETHKTKTCAACGKSAAHNAVRKCVHCGHSFGIEKKASDKRGRRFKCCGECGEMATSNRAKQCKVCFARFELTYKRKAASERRKTATKRRQTGKVVSLAAKRQKTKNVSNEMGISPTGLENLWNPVVEMHTPSTLPEMRQVSRTPSMTPIGECSSALSTSPLLGFGTNDDDVQALLQDTSPEDFGPIEACLAVFDQEIGALISAQAIGDVSGSNTLVASPFVPTTLVDEEASVVDVFLDEIADGLLGGDEIENVFSV
jgi:hypothetical protein